MCRINVVPAWTDSRPSKLANRRSRDVVPSSIPNAVALRNMFKYTLIPTKNAGPDASAVPRRVPASSGPTVDEVSPSWRPRLALLNALTRESTGVAVDVRGRGLGGAGVRAETESRGRGGCLFGHGIRHAVAKYRNVSGFFARFGGRGGPKHRVGSG